MRSAMRAASQLPGRRPTDVDIVLYLQVNKKSGDDLIFYMYKPSQGGKNISLSCLSLGRFKAS